MIMETDLTRFGEGKAILHRGEIASSNGELRAQRENDSGLFL